MSSNLPFWFLLGQPNGGGFLREKGLPCRPIYKDSRCQWKTLLSLLAKLLGKANRDHSLDNPPVQADQGALPAIVQGNEERSKNLNVNVVSSRKQIGASRIFPRNAETTVFLDRFEFQKEAIGSHQDSTFCFK